LTSGLTLSGAEPEADFRSLKSLVAAAKDEAGIAKAFGEDSLKSGKGVLAHAGEFLVAVRSPSPARVTIDEGTPVSLRRVGSSDLYVSSASLSEGTTHNVQFLAEGQAFEVVQNVRAFPQSAYEKSGVPQGKLSDKMVHESKIYPETKTDWWLYVPAQYKAGTPAGLMVWQDGEGLVKRDGSRVQIMIDNLTHEGKIPVIVHMFISPASRQMRPIEYDRLDDTYARFLRDEVVPKAAAMYDIRKDAYSRAITGASSGGICAFNAAWNMPDQFSRVLSLVGSFTSIQWKPGERDGGNLYPFMVRKMPKRNLRVWLQDGYNDLENDHGSWPLQNLQMANSLKRKGYDFALRWTSSYHGGGGKPDLADGLIWLWRGYDSSKTAEEFVQDPAEMAKPEFRVRALNRD
ncbi:MAG: esterase family protein, partial [Bryobacteraceae bacterium]|nr:esterase family protein [Bryobacteraceae bacterium]